MEILSRTALAATCLISVAFVAGCSGDTAGDTQAGAAKEAAKFTQQAKPEPPLTPEQQRLVNMGVSAGHSPTGGNQQGIKPPAGGAPAGGGTAGGAPPAGPGGPAPLKSGGG